MAIYDYVVNNAEQGLDRMPELVERLKEVDANGQFLASTVRYLYAIDRERYRDVIPQLLEAAISRDKERRYIGSLLEAIWGKGYEERADMLRETDDCFRKIYKRIYERTV